jgi:hypothetical protein
MAVTIAGGRMSALQALLEENDVLACEYVELSKAQGTQLVERASPASVLPAPVVDHASEADPQHFGMRSSA